MKLELHWLSEGKRISENLNKHFTRPCYLVYLYGKKIAVVEIMLHEDIYGAQQSKEFTS